MDTLDLQDGRIQPPDSKPAEASAIAEKRRKWSGTLVEMADVLTAMFKKRGRDPEGAQAEAWECVQSIAFYFGGRTFYLPGGARAKCYLRDREIASLYNGSNALELAAKYGISERMIQIILARPATDAGKPYRKSRAQVKT